MKMEIKYVVASHERMMKSDVEMKCSKCDAAIFFSDDWDWEIFKPICQDCVRKFDECEFVIIQKTEESVKSQTKISDYEFECLIPKVKESLRSK